MRLGRKEINLLRKKLGDGGKRNLEKATWSFKFTDEKTASSITV